MRIFDSAEVNIPGRTRNLNAELDRFKREQAKEMRAKRRAVTANLKVDREKAKRLFELHGENIIKRFSARFGAREIKCTLEHMVKWEPVKFIELVEKFLIELRKGGV